MKMNQETESRRNKIAAISFVTEFYESEGWSVTSVKQENGGYDLICERNNERQNIKVKAISGIQPHFIIMDNELNQAKDDALFVLCIVFSALSNPTFERWTGVKMLQDFYFSPVSYKAKLKPV